MKTFDFGKRGYIDVPLEVLARTVKYSLSQGNLPKTRPVDHVEFIETIVTLCQKILGKKAEVRLDHVTIGEAQSVKTFWTKEDEKEAPGMCPIEKYLIHRVLGNIHIEGKWDDERFNTALAFCYNEKGIQVGWGQNVKVCTNQTIYGGDWCTTYGKNKVNYEKLLDVVEGWLNNTQSIAKEYQGIINELEQMDIPENSIHGFLGKLFINAVLANENVERSAEHLNISQLVKVAKGIHEHFADIPVTEEEKVITAWELTNIGTFLLNPGYTDPINMIETNTCWNNRIVEWFLEKNVRRD